MLEKTPAQSVSLTSEIDDISNVIKDCSTDEEKENEDQNDNNRKDRILNSNKEYISDEGEYQAEESTLMYPTHIPDFVRFKFVNILITNITHQINNSINHILIKNYKLNF